MSSLSRISATAYWCRLTKCSSTCVAVARFLMYVNYAVLEYMTQLYAIVLLLIA